VNVETHLLDFSDDIYGSYITVFFKKLIRIERHFSKEEALKRQISLDTEAARQFFAANLQ